MRKFAFGTIPGMDTDAFRGYLMNFVFARRTIPIILAHAVQSMFHFVMLVGAVPAVFTECLFIGVVTRTAVAFGTIPIPAGTTFVVSVPGLIFGTTPAMFTGGIRTVTGTVAVIAIGAPPLMRATVGLGVNPRRRIRSETDDTEPITVRANPVRRMMCFLANGARPVVFATFGCIEYLLTTFV